MISKRRQLTLFLEGQEAEAVETVRWAFNPLQYELIKAHVTLCREDEIEPLEKVMGNLTNLKLGRFAVDFGEVIRFSEGKGVLIPAIGDNVQFHKLREHILKGIIGKPRKHEPHITLMHPRNSICTDELFEYIQKHPFPNRVTFSKISLIEQKQGKEWVVLKEFYLKSERTARKF